MSLLNRKNFAVGTAVLLAVSATGFAQSAAKPDAQIEANVLRALAGAPELSTQNIQTTTVYGVVTLTGTVHDDTLRTKAENLAARADGVKKVVDELTLGDTPVVAAESSVAPAPTDDSAANASGCQLQSDGSCAHAAAGTQSATQMSDNAAPPPPDDNGNVAPQDQATQNGNQSAGNYPPPPPRRPLYNNPNYNPNGAPSGPPPPDGVRGGQQGGGQQAGLQVTVPAGAELHIRINRGLRTDHTQPGTKFDATVLNDVVAGGAIAIPRGAIVQGTVIDAKAAGALKGRGELALQLNGLTLGGQQYMLNTDPWVRNGADKTTHTVNSAIVGGALGALFGAAVGGGAGAAVGAGVGGGLGVASSAASPSGQVAVPPESVLSFKLSQPETVTTVGQGELQRLAYNAGPPPPPQPVRRRYYPAPYPYPYYGR